jgi:hypothetical protein
MGRWAMNLDQLTFSLIQSLATEMVRLAARSSPKGIRDDDDLEVDQCKRNRDAMARDVVRRILHELHVDDMGGCPLCGS